jgi:hypothetical protein
MDPGLMVDVVADVTGADRTPSAQSEYFWG